MEDCLICHDSILDQPVSALTCGHVYHRKCISSWLNQSRGECPQCKQPCFELRALRIKTVRGAKSNTVAALHASNAELRSDLQASTEEKQRRKSECNQQWQDILETLAQSSERCHQDDMEADEVQRKRHKLREEDDQSEVKIQQLDERLKEAEKRSAGTRFHLDAAHQQHAKLPVGPPSEDDPDAKSERRKLHSMQQDGRRVTDRSRYVHEQFVSTLSHHTEGQLLAQKHQAAAKEAESVVHGLRMQVEELRKQRSEMQVQDLELLDDADDLRTESRSTASQTTGRSPLSRPGTPSSPAPVAGVAKVLNVSNRRPATPSRNAGGLKRPEDEEEEDRLLFGGPAKLQRKGSGGFGRAAAAPGRAGGAGLVSAPQVTLRRTAPKKSSIKTLFEQF